VPGGVPTSAAWKRYACWPRSPPSWKRSQTGEIICVGEMEIIYFFLFLHQVFKKRQVQLNGLQGTWFILTLSIKTSYFITANVNINQFQTLS
jgi:hypothetical protein